MKTVLNFITALLPVGSLGFIMWLFGVFPFPPHVDIRKKKVLQSGKYDVSVRVWKNCEIVANGSWWDVPNEQVADAIIDEQKQLHKK